MNIYIYGSQSFKKEIYNTLIHSNIKSKLDATSIIKEITTLEELKKIIQENPKEIFLIDDSKIIKKNSLNKRLKFLAPKDGIEEEFLLNSGISDLTVDSLDEIPKYILRKYEKLELLEKEDLVIEEDSGSLEISENISQDESESESENKNENENLNKSFDEDTIDTHENNIDLDDELAGLLIKNEDPIPNDEEMETSIKELEDLFVNEEQQESVYANDSVDFNDNFGLNNISFDYDANDTINDEKFLEALLNGTNIEEENFDNIEESFEDIDFLDDILNKTSLEKEETFEIKEEFENIEEFEIKDEPLEKEDILELDELLSKIEETKEIKEVRETEKIEEVENIHIEETIEIKVNEPLKGDMMSEDDFSELDLLSEKDLIDALNLENNATPQTEQAKVQVVDSQKEAINISSSNVDDLAKLFSKILNNKTLEITIKIKD